MDNEIIKVYEKSENPKDRITEIVIGDSGLVVISWAKKRISVSVFEGDCVKGFISESFDDLCFSVQSILKGKALRLVIETALRVYQ